jgi:hypothetical protein
VNPLGKERTTVIWTGKIKSRRELLGTLLLFFSTTAMAAGADNHQNGTVDDQSSSAVSTEMNSTQLAVRFA